LTKITNSSNDYNLVIDAKVFYRFLRISTIQFYYKLKSYWQALAKSLMNLQTLETLCKVSLKAIV